MSQFTITGFDACGGCCKLPVLFLHHHNAHGGPLDARLCAPVLCAGHMSEETRNADVSAAWGIIIAILTSAAVGWGYILALCFAIQV